MTLTLTRTLIALLLCVTLAILALPMRDRIEPANTAMLFLLLVFLVALELGRPLAGGAVHGPLGDLEAHRHRVPLPAQLVAVPGQPRLTTRPVRRRAAARVRSGS